MEFFSEALIRRIYCIPIGIHNFLVIILPEIINNFILSIICFVILHANTHASDNVHSASKELLIHFANNHATCKSTKVTRVMRIFMQPSNFQQIEYIVDRKKVRARWNEGNLILSQRWHASVGRSKMIDCTRDTRKVQSKNLLFVWLIKKIKCN